MKKRFRFEFECNIYTVDVERNGNEIIVDWKGKSYSVTLLPEEKIKEKPLEVERPNNEKAKVIRSAPIPLPAQTTTGLGEGYLLAPMTGVIKEVQVVDGQSVEQGQVVLIMEAMKMNIDVHAHVSGVASEISLRPGDNVQANQKLMKIQ